MLASTVLWTHACFNVLSDRYRFRVQRTLNSGYKNIKSSETRQEVQSKFVCLTADNVIHSAVNDHGQKHWQDSSAYERDRGNQP